MAITGAGKGARLVADKRAGDDPADVVAAGGQRLAGQLAQGIETLQAEGLLMAGDLKHRIGRGVEDGLAAAHVLLAQLIEDLGAGRVTVAQKTWQLGATDQRLQQLGRKAVLVSGEVAPIEEHGRARHLPVARRGILARGDLLGVAIGGLRHHAGIKPGRELTTGPGAGMGQP